MKIDELVDFKKKTRVGELLHLVTNGRIFTYRVLGYHPEFYGHVYLIDERDVRRCIGVYMETDMRFWTDQYTVALDEMWRQKVEDIKKINSTLFDGMKTLVITPEEGI